MTQTNYFFDFDVDQDDIENCVDQLPVLIYLAGYCVYGVSKKLKCSACKDLLSYQEAQEQLPENNYILGISRRGLIYLHESVVNVVMYSYVNINKLTQCPDLIIYFPNDPLIGD